MGGAVGRREKGKRVLGHQPLPEGGTPFRMQKKMVEWTFISECQRMGQKGEGPGCFNSLRGGRLKEFRKGSKQAHQTKDVRIGRQLGRKKGPK